MSQTHEPNFQPDEAALWAKVICIDGPDKIVSLPAAIEPINPARVNTTADISTDRMPKPRDTPVYPT
jgi:hypothetical protein